MPETILTPGGTVYFRGIGDSGRTPSGKIVHAGAAAKFDAKLAARAAATGTPQPAKPAIAPPPVPPRPITKPQLSPPAKSPITGHKPVIAKPVAIKVVPPPAPPAVPRQPVGQVYTPGPATAKRLGLPEGARVRGTATGNVVEMPVTLKPKVAKPVPIKPKSPRDTSPAAKDDGAIKWDWDAVSKAMPDLDMSRLQSSRGSAYLSPSGHLKNKAARTEQWYEEELAKATKDKPPSTAQRIRDSLKEAVTLGHVDTKTYNTKSLGKEYDQQRAILGAIFDGDETEVTKQYRAGAYDHMGREAGHEAYTQDHKLACESKRIPEKEGTKAEYVHKNVGTKREYVKDVLKAQPTGGKIAKEFGLAMIPVYGTIRTWKDSSNTGRAIGIAADVLWVIPFAGGISSGVRATTGLSRTAAAMRGLRTAAIAEVKAPMEMVLHPVRTVKTTLEPLETMFHPKKLPIAGAETRYHTQKINVTGDADSFMRLRDNVVKSSITEGKTTAKVDDIQVDISQPRALKDIRPAMFHATPDVRPFMDGAVIGASKEGELFISPSLHSRFAQQSAHGTAPTGGVKGAVLIRDERLISQVQGSKKLYQGAAEVEGVIKEGATLPAPSQTLFTRDAGGDKVTILVLGKPLSRREIAKFKLIGSADTLTSIFKKDVTVSVKGKKASRMMDNLIDKENELKRLRALDRRAAATTATRSQIGRLTRQIERIRSDINNSKEGRLEYVAISTRDRSIFTKPSRRRPTEISRDRTTLVVDPRGTVRGAERGKPSDKGRRRVPPVAERRIPVLPADRGRVPAPDRERTPPTDRGRTPPPDRGPTPPPDRGPTPPPDRGRTPPPDRGRTPVPDRGRVPTPAASRAKIVADKGRGRLLLPGSTTKGISARAGGGQISWQQGELLINKRRRPQWITIGPGGQKEYSMKPPKGAKIVAGPPRRTIFSRGKVPASREVNVGFFRATVSRHGQSISFRRGKRRRGQLLKPRKGR